jgi:hypothetical protein
LELVLRYRIVAGHGMAFRRRFLPALVPFSPHCLHDNWVYLMMAALGPVAYLSEPTTLYRTHSTQAMGGEKHDLIAVADKLAGFGPTADEVPWWEDILDRLLAFPQFAADPATAERLLREKIAFIRRRTRNRDAHLPGRVLGASLELLRGRYHRLGRGFLAWGRDLYGNR